MSSKMSMYAEEINEYGYTVVRSRPLAPPEDTEPSSNHTKNIFDDDEIPIIEDDHVTTVEDIFRETEEERAAIKAYREQEEREQHEKRVLNHERRTNEFYNRFDSPEYQESVERN